MPKPSATNPQRPKFEDALAQIESIIERIEAGEIGLEESLVEYERGVGLIQHCRDTLDNARKKVEDLTSKLEAAGDEADDESEANEDEEHVTEE
jgi:exodeoxyribonuclease VII small subunit